MDSEFEHQLDEIAQSVIHEFESLGLYATNTGIGLVPSTELTPEAIEELSSQEHPDVAAELKNGNLDAMMFFSFRIGDIAWSDRVLDPDGYESRKEFERIMPDQSEIDVLTVVEDIFTEDWSVFDKKKDEEED